jgi:hypothetical protein
MDEKKKRTGPVPWYICTLCTVEQTYVNIVCDCIYVLLLGVLCRYGPAMGVPTWVLIIAAILLCISILWLGRTIYHTIIYLIENIHHGRTTDYCHLLDDEPPPEVKDDR